ncbi:MAG: tol-pal system-associated acyl-CoA thioesterase [Gammaproteobacteria bacterium]
MSPPGVAAREFVWPVRVYYEDTDAAGIVYHANYLRFMERARTEWLRAVGFEQDALRAEQGVVFVVTRTNVRYRRAARFNEALEVVTRIERLRRVSIEFEQRIIDADGALVCDAGNELACVDAERFVPRRVPDPILRTFDLGS